MAKHLYRANPKARERRSLATIAAELVKAGYVNTAKYRGESAARPFTGTGLAAEAALALVGPTGHVTATDISPQMVERARERYNPDRRRSGAWPT